MIAGTAANRTRRLGVAASVLLAHVLLVWLALLARTGRDAEATLPVFVTTMFELPRAQGPWPAEPQTQDRPRLQEFAPALPDVPVEPPDIEVPEVEPAQTPLVAEVPAPASAPVPAQSDAGLGAEAGDSSGQSGNGNGLVLLQRVLPVYPVAAARRGERGITQVILHVTRSGRVDQVKVERSSGSSLLDAAALEAFRKWRFQPLPEASKDGRWLRTTQRFILYQFMYSRLDAQAMQYVYGENLKPKSGTAEEETPGAREALLRFIAQVRDQTLDVRGGATEKDLAELRANLGKWGATKSVGFSGMVGSGRWLRQGIRPDLDRDGRRDVEVSWNSFEVRHENATCEWLTAVDREGQIWVARAGQTS